MINQFVSPLAISFDLIKLVCKVIAVTKMTVSSRMMRFNANQIVMKTA